MSSLNICSECGKKIGKDDKFCRSCGIKIEQNEDYDDEFQDDTECVSSSDAKTNSHVTPNNKTEKHENKKDNTNLICGIALGLSDFVIEFAINLSKYDSSSSWGQGAFFGASLGSAVFFFIIGCFIVGPILSMFIKK